ncbi:GtrA family protein [Glacieibacterium megasporae]|uniref:GtrA family protein n=1 Tax=Glacieibacterium megasporae TaxID=2835787 RepID=UPI001C1E200B|nr:GtrA family protein [Polymorphobacter megasporae]UAJ09806.1 GtrA family protein [Polymorphobacter megasporae]
MQLLRFLTVGVANTLLTLAIIYLLMHLGVDYRVANAVGYLVGFVVSFVLNRNWTFAHEGHWVASLARWLVVAAVAYGGNLLTVVVLHQWLGVDARLAQLGGMPVYTLISYAGGRFFAFTPSPMSEETR